MKTVYSFRAVLATIPLLLFLFAFTPYSYSQECEFEDVEVKKFLIK